MPGSEAFFNVDVSRVRRSGSGQLSLNNEAAPPLPPTAFCFAAPGSEAFFLIGVTRVGFTPCSPVARQGKHSAVALQ